MFTYDHDENVLQAFCENWRPSTNIVSTFVGELSIYLWNLRTIGGLPVHGSFYDEMIKGSLFSQEAAPSCFRRSTDLPMVPSTKSLFVNGQSFGLWGRENMPSLRQGHLRIVQNQG
ncbi:hypothetical protein H5410_006763 [Solanum commersonii]|uniref:Uncharacterized protein n=1 Tax=Solanum commersonii TaxID=4109 RepID=A0A9J6AAP7_SOLCO|nr:hypothetical protein H5410_006763 [Solanum commersonii]